MHSLAIAIVVATGAEGINGPAPTTTAVAPTFFLFQRAVLVDVLWKVL